MKTRITEEQFKEKYNKYYKELYHISLGYTKNKDDSEDIIQNVFLKYLKYDKTFKTIDEEKYWLIRVTINESIDYIKSYYYKNVINNNDIVLNSQEIKINNDTIKNILDYVDKSPKKYKQILILYYFDDLSIKDISKILNISESSIKMRLKRARDYLKNKMED